MTYCVGILLEAGLVMIADTRTNAGVDNISSYRKLHILADEPGRTIFAATSGNLSITQTVLGQLAEGMPSLLDGEAIRHVGDMPTMFRVAQFVGEAVQATRAKMLPALDAAKVSAGISILLGGRVGTEHLCLFLIYSAGNFIACERDQPFLQIGETKYGKPILDRALHYDTPLDEAVKLGFISFDSTIRSNLAVGRPLDLVVISSDPAKPTIQRRIEADDVYFDDLSARWSMMLDEARATIPDPPFMQEMAG